MSDSDEVVRVEERPDGVAVVTLCRPHVLNAVSTDMARQLTAAIARLEGVAGCIVLTGEGARAFGAGLDLRELREAASDQRARQQETMLAMQKTLSRSAVPIVAAVNGMAMGASWQMALHGDLVVAADSAQFAMPEIAAGQPCIIGSWLLSSLIPVAAVTDIVLTGRRVSAAEAQSIGLVHRVVADEALLEVAIGLASDLAARRSRSFDATRAWIRALRYERRGGFAHALDHADAVLADINRISKEASP